MREDDYSNFRTDPNITARIFPEFSWEKYGFFTR